MVLTQSCGDEYARHINEARGCVPDAASAATSQPAKH